MKAEAHEDSPGADSAVGNEGRAQGQKGKAKGKAKGRGEAKGKAKGNERQWHLKTAQGPTVRLAMALSM